MTELAVIYCRKSDPNAKSDDPAFDQQEEACRKYCDERGYVVLGDARRESYTGMDLSNQEKLWDCVEDIKRDRAHVVVAYSYDRLSRDPTMQTVALYEIENKYGGRFEAATEQLDRSNPFHEAMRGVLGVASKVEHDRIVGRFQRGQVDRVKRQQLYGASNPKFGYRWADDAKHERTKFEVDEESAKTVRRIFEWFDEGKSLRWIARELNMERVPTPSMASERQGHRGERKLSHAWRHLAILRILQDTAYIGLLEGFKRQFSKEQTKNPMTGIIEGKQVFKMRDKTDSKWTQLYCPAIVSEEQWNRAQARLATNVDTRQGRPTLDPEITMARHFVYCKCGQRMAMVHHKKHHYGYKCPLSRSKHPESPIVCPHGDMTIYASVVNNFVMEEVSQVLAEKGLLRQLVARKAQDDAPLRAIVENLTALVKRKTAEQDQFLEGLRSASNATVIKALMEKAEACAKEVEEATVSLREGRMRLGSIEAYNQSFDASLAWVEQFPADALFTIHPERRRLLFRHIGMRVEVSPATNDGTPRLKIGYGLQGDMPFSGSTHSCVEPGPPCSSNSFFQGALPTRFVQTRNLPLGVSIGMSRTPPLSRSARPEESR